MAIKGVFAFALLVWAFAIVGCGEKTVPADPSVSKIGVDDGSDPKDAKRLGKKGNSLPGSSATGATPAGAGADK